MSLDARYILKYQNLPYIEPSPMAKDKEYLEKTFGGEMVQFDQYGSYYYNKPKYTLTPDEINKLLADQVLECKDGDDVWLIKTNMTSVNETNAITEYKKRLVEKLVKKEPTKHEGCTLDDMWCYNHKEIMEDKDYPNGAYSYNQALDDVLDLINSTN